MKFFSTFLIIVGVGILLFIFGPVIKAELKYSFDQITHIKYSVDTEVETSFEKTLTIPNIDFSIVIPKIGASAPVVINVDPNDKYEYLKALKTGVAHAKGTALPGEPGNVYVFAHSTDAFYNVGKYNAVFYLLGKLKKGDEIYIYYQGIKIKYLVDQVKVVSPSDIKYLSENSEQKILTLQTCYPPGTTIDRLVVIANETE